MLKKTKTKPKQKVIKKETKPKHKDNFDWEAHRKHISEFADAKIVYPDEQERQELVKYARKQNKKRTY
tara:strand:+ start:91 stop:294 length:204 start_codon:yes stop_codon:yes gene_type:complete